VTAAGHVEFEAVVMADYWVCLFRSPSIVLLHERSCTKAAGSMLVIQTEHVEGAGRHGLSEGHELVEDPFNTTVILQ